LFVVTEKVAVDAPHPGAVAIPGTLWAKPQDAKQIRNAVIFISSYLQNSSPWFSMINGEDVRERAKWSRNLLLL
jgi:hypothetical protein